MNQTQDTDAYQVLPSGADSDRDVANLEDCVRSAVNMFTSFPYRR
jgi:hypothetical protein